MVSLGVERVKGDRVAGLASHLVARARALLHSTFQGGDRRCARLVMTFQSHVHPELEMRLVSRRTSIVALAVVAGAGLSACAGVIRPNDDAGLQAGLDAQRAAQAGVDAAQAALAMHLQAQQAMDAGRELSLQAAALMAVSSTPSRPN